MIQLMIAEDEKIERDSLRLLIETYYADKIQIVYEATTGKDIVELVLKFKPHIVLMDIQMPQMNGLEAAERIKKEYQETEIIFLTAHSFFEYAKKAVEIGAVDYLVKPFSNQKFLSVMDQVLEKIHLREHHDAKQHELYEQLNNLKRLLKKHGINTELPTNARDDHIVELVKRYIENNLSKEISLEKVAKEIGMSSFYLSKYFKKIEGINFKDYMIRVRMDKAKYLLSREKMNVQETSAQVGYSDPNYFSRAFKKFTGMSPTDFIRFI